MSENDLLPAKNVPAPRDLTAKSKRFWREILRLYALDPQHMALLHQLCRTYDDLDELAAVVRRDGVVVQTLEGAAKVHPAVVEARQMRQVVARLTSVLGLPDGYDEDEGDGDAAA